METEGNEMKGRKRLQIFLLSFVIIILLNHFLIHPILADDKFGLSFNPIPNEPPSKPLNPDQHHYQSRYKPGQPIHSHCLPSGFHLLQAGQKPNCRALPR